MRVDIVQIGKFKEAVSGIPQDLTLRTIINLKGNGTLVMLYSLSCKKSLHQKILFLQQMNKQCPHGIARLLNVETPTLH